MDIDNICGLPKSYPVISELPKTPAAPHAPGDEAKRSWDFWKGNFIKRDKDGCYFVEDQSPEQANNKRIVSEGMAFGLMLADQMGDEVVFERIYRAVKNNFLGRGLPYWSGRFYGEKAVGLQFKSLTNAEQSSASDADQDMAFAFIRASQKVRSGQWNKGGITAAEYAETAQFFLNLLWEKAVYYREGTALMKPSEDWGEVSGGVVVNISYSSPFMYELFAQFDKDQTHNWARLAQETVRLREGILSQNKDLVVISEELRKANPYLPYTQAPDWLVAIPKGERFELYPYSPRSAKMGFDGIRTMWRLALDAVHMQDPVLRRQCVLLARQMMKALDGKKLPENIGLYDNKFNVEYKDRVIVLAAYTALAFAAKQPTGIAVMDWDLGNYENKFQGVYDKLGERYFDKQQAFFKDKTAQIQDRYYEQTISLLSYLTARGGFKTEPLNIWKPEISREIQQLDQKYFSWPFIIFQKYALGGDYSGQARMEALEIVRDLDLDDNRNSLFSRYGSYGKEEVKPLAAVHLDRLAAAQKCKEARLFVEARRQLTKVLKESKLPDEKNTLRDAIESFSSVATELALPAGELIKIYRSFSLANDNPYLRLALGRALLDSYKKENYDKALVLGEQLYSQNRDPNNFDPYLMSRSAMLLAEYHQRLAVNLAKDPGASEAEARNNLDESEEHFERVSEILEGTWYEIQKLYAVWPGTEIREQIGDLIYHTADSLKETVHREGVLLSYVEAQVFLAKAKTTALDPDKKMESARLAFSLFADVLNDRDLRRHNKELISKAVQGMIDSQFWTAYGLSLKEQNISSGMISYPGQRKNLEDSDEYKFAIALADKVKNRFTPKDDPLIQLPEEMENALRKWVRLIYAQYDAAEVFWENRVEAQKNRVDGTIAQLDVLTSRMVILGSGGAAKKDQVESGLIEIMKLFPRNRISGHLERVAYFLRKGETHKALKDCAGLIELLALIGSGDGHEGILEERAEEAVLGLIMKLRKLQAKGGKVDILKEIGEVSNRRLARDIADFISTPGDQRDYDDFIGRLERRVEVSRALRLEPADREKFIESLKNIYSVAENISDGNILKASERIEQIIRETNEDPFRLDFYERALGAFQCYAWYLHHLSAERQKLAISLLLEILGEKYAKLSEIGSDSTLGTAVEYIRDKENRGFINQMFDQDPIVRSELLIKVAEMHYYSALNDKYTESIGYLRLALGLSKDRPKTVKEEIAEYSGFMRDLRSRGVISRIIVSTYANGEDKRAGALEKGLAIHK